MPFASEKQRAEMFAQHPEIAKRWEAEAKRKHEPDVKPRHDAKELYGMLTGKKRK